MTTHPLSTSYVPNCTAADVHEGDLIDIAGPVSVYYDTSARDMAEFELFEVESVVRETDDCVVIYSGSGSAGMPPSTPIYREPPPRVSLVESDTARMVGRFWGPDAMAAVHKAMRDGVEYGIDVSDERCSSCNGVFWHEAAVESSDRSAWCCPHCDAELPREEA